VEELLQVYRRLFPREDGRARSEVAAYWDFARSRQWSCLTTDFHAVTRHRFGLSMRPAGRGVRAVIQFRTAAVSPAWRATTAAAKAWASPDGRTAPCTSPLRRRRGR